MSLESKPSTPRTSDCWWAETSLNPPVIGEHRVLEETKQEPSVQEVAEGKESPAEFPQGGLWTVSGSADPLDREDTVE